MQQSCDDHLMRGPGPGLGLLSLNPPLDTECYTYLHALPSRIAEAKRGSDVLDPGSRSLTMRCQQQIHSVTLLLACDGLMKLAWKIPLAEQS